MTSIEVNNEEDSTAMMKKFDKEWNKIKFKSFGKVSTSNGALANPKLRNLQKNKKELLKNAEVKDHMAGLKKVDEAISDEIISCQRASLDKQLALLKDAGVKKGRSAAVFQLKEIVTGKKSQDAEAMPMKDPVNDEKLYDPKEIQNAAGKYCEEQNASA